MSRMVKQLHPITFTKPGAKGDGGDIRDFRPLPLPLGAEVHPSAAPLGPAHAEPAHAEPAHAEPAAAAFVVVVPPSVDEDPSAGPAKA